MLFLIFFRVKDSELVSNAFNVDPLYLKHDHQGKIPDYRVSKKTDNRIMTFILPVMTFVTSDDICLHWHIAQKSILCKGEI